jgi:hypothetical protein
MVHNQAITKYLWKSDISYVKTLLKTPAIRISWCIAAAEWADTMR